MCGLSKEDVAYLLEGYELYGDLECVWLPSETCVSFIDGIVTILE